MHYRCANSANTGLSDQSAANVVVFSIPSPSNSKQVKKLSSLNTASHRGITYPSNTNRSIYLGATNPGTTARRNRRTAFLPALCLAALLCLTACQHQTLHGNKVMVSERMRPGQFSGLDIRIPAQIHYDINQSEPIVDFTTDQNIFELMQFYVDGKGNLVIAQKASNVWLKPTRLDIHANSAALERIRINGSATVDVGNPAKTSPTDYFQADEFEIDVNGAGKITFLRPLNACSLEIEVNGAADIFVDGQGEKAEIEINGSGRVNAGHFACQRAECEINGSGRIDVNASQRLEAEINGAGGIFYRGNPQLKASRQTSLRLRQTD